MHKKLFYFILLLCFFKLFHVAYKSVQFSPNILFNSFKRNVAEKSSLGFVSKDVIPLIDKGILSNTLISTRTAKEYHLTSNQASNYEEIRSPYMGAGELAENDIINK